MREAAQKNLAPCEVVKIFRASGGGVRKKSGPKFKMKIVFCISTNIRHDMIMQALFLSCTEPGSSSSSDFKMAFQRGSK
jgi:hypothetical protein